MAVTEYGGRTFDRRLQFDERSRQYPIRALLGTAVPRVSRTWACPTWLDQGNDGACVGFGWAHELVSDPVRVPESYDSAMVIYNRAKQLDQWPGEEYSGTSVLGGAKAVQESGHMPEYRWAFGLDDVIDTVCAHGPVVIGIDWWSTMMEPDEYGFVTLTGGHPVGGHCLLIRGVACVRKYFRLRNSWGRGWGVDGDCRISWDDMGRLLANQGDACVPVRRT